MLKVCSDLFESWNNNEVKYCHWKSNEHLMEGLDGLTDLDVYVAPDDRNKAESDLIKNKYIKFVPQKGAVYPNVDEWIGFDYDTGRLVHVHLHYQIITGTKYNKEYVFPMDELLVSSRLIDKETGVYVASPNLEIIILYLRIVLKASDKKKIVIDDDYKREIEYLKERVSFEILKKYCVDLIGEQGLAVFNMIMKDKLGDDEWFKLYAIAEDYLCSYRKYSKNKVKLRYRYYRLRNIKNAVFNSRLNCNYIQRKTLPEKGMSICFLGADGSGKSTISIEIQKWLNWKIEAKRFYLGSGDHYNSLTKHILAKFAGKTASGKVVSNNKTASGDSKSSGNNKAEEKISFKRRILRRGYALLQSTYLKQISVRSYKEIKKANKYTKNGAVALYDRFPQNQFANLYDGPKVAARYLGDYKDPYIKLMSYMEEKAIKKAQSYMPNIIFKLHLPPEESIRRKPDHTMEEVRPKAEITGKLKFEASHVYDIDATQDYNSEILEIKRFIWDEMVNK